MTTTVADQFATAAANLHITLARLGAQLLEALEALAAAARKALAAMDDSLTQLRARLTTVVNRTGRPEPVLTNPQWHAFKRLMRHRLAWRDRGRPAPLAIDGHAYHHRYRARRRRNHRRA